MDIGLDVHKDGIVVAVAENRRRGGGAGICPDRVGPAPSRWLGWHARPAKGGRAEVLLFSEVVWLRDLAPVVDEWASGHGCVVVAASLIPKQPSDWIKGV